VFIAVLRTSFPPLPFIFDWDFGTPTGGIRRMREESTSALVAAVFSVRLRTGCWGRRMKEGGDGGRDDEVERGKG
jgi:hypothetical protein